MGEVKDTILGTLKGANNEGSSKRITAAYLCIVSLSLLTITYCFGFIWAYLAVEPTKVHIMIIEMFIYIFAFVLLALAAVLGLTNLDSWINIIPFVKKFKSEEKKEPQTVVNIENTNKDA